MPLSSHQGLALVPEKVAKPVYQRKALMLLSLLGILRLSPVLAASAPWPLELWSHCLQSPTPLPTTATLPRCPHPPAPPVARLGLSPDLSLPVL